MPSDLLNIAEIFYSLQGESTFAGYPCAFVRLAGCNLRCKWCDSPVAAAGEGTPLTVETIVERVRALRCPLVEVTGGEPLVQNATPRLCRQLLDAGFAVLLETNGSVPLAEVDPAVVKIVDVKTPSSGMADSFLLDNLNWVKSRDQLKFVVADEVDFSWACQFLNAHSVPAGVEILFSPLTPGVPAAELARWLLEAHLPVRLQIQLHKTLGLP